MNFPQRLKRFMFGVLIGVLLSAFFFRDKLDLFTSWLPGNVVKTRVEDSYRYELKKTDCLLNCYSLSWDSLMVLVDDGDVDFGRSKRDEEPKEYQITHVDSGTEMRFAVRDSSVTLLTLGTPRRLDCDCN